MSNLEKEYNDIQTRQEAIRADMLGVAAAIEKINSSLGKKIAAEITSKALNAAGAPIKIPAEFGYFSIGLLGLIPATIEANKMKKYKARILELETEYNTNAQRLQEIETQLKAEVSMNEKKSLVGSNEPKSNSSLIVWTILSFVSVGLLVWVRKRKLAAN